MPKRKASGQPKRAAEKKKPGLIKKAPKKEPAPKKEKAPKAAKATKPAKAPKTTKAPKPDKTPKTAASKKKATLIAVLAVLVLAGVYAALCASVNPEQVLPKTRFVYQLSQTAGADSSQAAVQTTVDLEQNALVADGLNIEGLQRSLEEDFHRRYDGQSLTVSASGKNYIVPVGNTLTLNTEELAQQALAPSQLPFLERGISRIRSLVAWRDIPALPTVSNQALLRANVQSSGLMEIDTTVQTTYEVKDKNLVFHKGKPGQSVDQDGLLQQLTAAVEAGNYEGTVECAMLSGEVAELDWAKVKKDICRKPENAKLELERNRREYSIVDAVNGVSFDEAAAKQALSAAKEGEDATVPLTYKAPEITTKRMKNKLFKHSLGSYSTWVSGTSDRISNVRLAAEKCDGIILNPGDEFSYNQTLGQRTAANGFKEAGAYLNGTTVQEVGGGICQISSTMYAAALKANLEIVERHNHTFASSYIGLGMDATVSWGGPDFRFKNNKDYPIKIVASYWEGQASVTIKGTRTDKITVEMEADVTETIPFSTTYREDPDMYEGKTRISQSGSDGYRVQTYRKVYDDGKLISKEKEAYSVYTPHEQIVYEGTKKKPEPKPEPQPDQSTDEKKKTDETTETTEETVQTEETTEGEQTNG